jgi:hypothetical protein
MKEARKLVFREDATYAALDKDDKATAGATLEKNCQHAY